MIQREPIRGRGNIPLKENPVTLPVNTKIANLRVPLATRLMEVFVSDKSRCLSRQFEQPTLLCSSSISTFQTVYSARLRNVEIEDQQSTVRNVETTPAFFRLLYTPSKEILHMVVSASLLFSIYFLFCSRRAQLQTPIMNSSSSRMLIVVSHT